MVAKIHRYFSLSVLLLLALQERSAAFVPGLALYQYNNNHETPCMHAITSSSSSSRFTARARTSDGARVFQQQQQQQQQQSLDFEMLETDHSEADSIVPILGQALSKCRMLQEHTNDVMYDDTKPSLSRLFAFLQESVYPQTSTINNAGRGLFAGGTSIPKGTIVSLYPVHAVGAVTTTTGEVHTAVSVEDEEYFEEQSYTTGYRLNLMGDRKFPGNYPHVLFQTTFIDTNPNTHRDDPLGWMAHLINDCAYHPSTKNNNDDDDDDETAILDYYQRALDTCNAVIVPFGPIPVCAAVTTRTVLEGEELFLAYGHAYWEYDSNSTSTTTKKVVSEKIQAAQNKAMYEPVMAAMREVEITYEQEAMELEQIFDMIG